MKGFRLVFALILYSLTVVAQSPLRKITNDAFQAGEKLEYRIHYGFVDAGIAHLEVKHKLSTINNRPCFHIVGIGETRGAFDWFFKVRDRYETYIDTVSLIPWIFIRRVAEGSYSKIQNVTFNHFKNTATSEKVTIPVPENVQDLVSAFFYARTLDFANASPGDVFPINAYLDDEVFQMNIKYIGKEKITTKLGTFNCVKFRPLLLEGRVFKEEEDMTVWVTDDKNRIVVRAEANILVGSIKMDLKGYSGLTNPLTSKIK
ncbi:MAG: DUF3108 domain-containing protein [Bacteroidota bacterium]|nr:DUF3108 domain-containing protein [Bacteroidota bacterium]